MRSGTKTQAPFRVDTPAKITPVLHVGRRRADGFHEVRIALVPVSLYDTLVFRPGAGEGIALRVESGEELGPPGENLVLRAAHAFREALGAPLSIRIVLVKRIPAGAGLGGGSGNAGGTLVALNRWCGHPLAPATLERLAAALGSDVPFFLDPRPAWAEGRGERVRPWTSLPPLALLVVKPPASIATAEAYRLVTPEPGAETVQSPRWDSMAAVAAGLFNRFEAALLPRHPELAEIKARLLALGAAGALVSGTGSAVFGVFAHAAARDAAAAALAGEQSRAGWRCLPCHSLNRHDYPFSF
jgi:4-diphosphocytidyl-2-C-methyl-D-erythritol kinase